MAELIRDHFHRDSRGHGQSGGRVAEIIQTNGSQTSGCKEPAKLPLHGSLLQGSASSRPEEQIVIQLAFATARLRMPHFFQSLQYEILKLDDPSTPLAFRIVEFPARSRHLNRAAYTRGATLPVSAILFQSQIFARTHSCGQPQSKQREPFGPFRDLQKAATFFDTQCFHLPPLQPWQINSNTRILG